MSVYVVTSGWYEDYRIEAVCADEPTALALAAQMNSTDDYARADVAEFAVRAPGWVPGHASFMHTWLNPRNGAVQRNQSSTSLDIRGEEEGATTDISLAAGLWHVRTRGDCRLVPPAHEEAVAAKRAEITGRMTDWSVGTEQPRASGPGIFSKD